MGIGIEWKNLLGQDPQLITVLPTDTEWVEDKTKPRFGAVLCDQTASVQQMNFAGCGQIITSGQEFERRIINKFLKDNLNYGAEHIVLLWDKPWPSLRRAEMYEQKRYSVPASDKTLPPGKIRGIDGRFYYPAQAPLPQFDESTGYGVKPIELITASKMYPLPQLLNAAWTKTQVAGFICKCLWTFAQSRPEHIVFDTPFLAGDQLCDGQMKCNKENCVICPDAKIPRHAEADVLYLFHIRHLSQIIPPTSFFMARGSTDRDLLVVLSFPFDQGISDRIWWCKGSGAYAMSPTGNYIKPGKNTGKPITCNEFVKMKRAVHLFGVIKNYFYHDFSLSFFLAVIIVQHLRDLLRRDFLKLSLIVKIQLLSIPIQVLLNFQHQHCINLFNMLEMVRNAAAHNLIRLIY